MWCGRMFKHQRQQLPPQKHFSACREGTRQLRVEAPPFRQKRQLHSETSVINPALVNTHPREQTHNTSHTDHVSLMILPALISNGKKELKVNVMLDPCSTSSHISEEAAEELELQGQALNLTIAGTGGAEIRTHAESKCQ